MDIEKYIGNLPPELQEKARACKSTDELLALAKEAKLPVPDDALAAIAGGNDIEGSKCFNWRCPKCHGYNTTIGSEVDNNHCNVHCDDCGHDWVQETGNLPA